MRPSESMLYYRKFMYIRKIALPTNRRAIIVSDSYLLDIPVRLSIQNGNMVHRMIIHSITAPAMQDKNNMQDKSHSAKNAITTIHAAVMATMNSCVTFCVDMYPGAYS